MKTKTTDPRKTAAILVPLMLLLIVIVSVCMSHITPTQNMAPAAPGIVPQTTFIS